MPVKKANIRSGTEGDHVEGGQREGGWLACGWAVGEMCDQDLASVQVKRIHLKRIHRRRHRSELKLLQSNMRKSPSPACFEVLSTKQKRKKHSGAAVSFPPPPLYFSPAMLEEERGCHCCELALGKSEEDWRAQQSGGPERIVDKLVRVCPFVTYPRVLLHVNILGGFMVGPPLCVSMENGYVLIPKGKPTSK